MTLPLIVLAVFAVIGGFIGISKLIEQFYIDSNLIKFTPLAFRSWDHPYVRSGLLGQLIAPFIESPLASLCGITAVVMGLVSAFTLYKKAATDPLPAKLGGLATAMKNRFYFDEFYEATFIRAHDFIAAVADWIDRWIVEGACIGLVRGGTDLTGRALRLAQTGNLQTYAFLFVLGVALLLYFVLEK
jgi:NADH-quinone oxidoreductase subunit L